MSRRGDAPEILPRSLLIGAAVVIGVSVVFAAAVRLSGTAPAGNAEALKRTVAHAIDVRFELRPDNGIDVFVPGRAAAVSEIAPDDAGFLRGLLRVLKRERMKVGADEGEPVSLIAWREGGVSLRDAASGTEIELSAFGPTNVGAFTRLFDLTMQAAARAEPEVATLDR